MVRKNISGFTLLELLIVVIIVGILAAVAIPQFLNATDRARETEARAMVDAILTAQSAYYQERGAYTTLTTELLVTIPTTMTNWVPPAAAGAYTIGAGNTNVLVSIGPMAAGTAHPDHNVGGTRHAIFGNITPAGVKTVTNNSSQ